MRRAVEWALRDFRVQVPDVETEVGICVEQAGTGEEALSFIRTAMPDILLLDHKLPGKSGLEVLDEIAGMSCDLLVIMITAYASIETAIAATRRGAYDFLAKPFTPDELKSTVRKAAIRVVLAREARRLAEERRQVRFQFIQVLGHELKAPLTAIEGFLQLMAGHSAGNDIAAYDHAVSRSLVRLEHMRKLIADLLDVTRIESGLKHRDLSPTNVVAVARCAIENMTAEASRRGIRIALHAEPDVVMKADRGELEMILNNLVSNAVKYNKQNGSVDVSCRRDAERVTIQVTDTGIGMTEENAAKLFTEFVRIRDNLTLHIPGSGLGLSIVRKLATLYAGRATVESAPGMGSTFTVVLQDEMPAVPSA